MQHGMVLSESELTPGRAFGTRARCNVQNTSVQVLIARIMTCKVCHITAFRQAVFLQPLAVTLFYPSGSD